MGLRQIWKRLSNTRLGKFFTSTAFGRWVMPRRGTEELLEAYSESTWIYATMSRRGKDVANAVWRTFRVNTRGMSMPANSRQKLAANLGRGFIGPNNQRNQALDQMLANNEVDEVAHPILDLLHKPNPLMDGLTFMKVLTITVALVGEAYVWAVPGRRSGEPAELWIIPPHWIHSTPTGEEPFYRVRHSRFNEDVPIEQMVKIVDPDPHHPYQRGVGAGRALGYEVDIDQKASQHILNFFDGGALPDILIGVEDATEDELKRAAAKFEESYRTSGMAHGAHWHSGKIVAQKLTPTFKESQMLELRQGSRNNIMQLQSMPPEIMGVIENSNRSTIESADYLYKLYTVLPDMQMIACAIQRQLLPMWSNSESLIFSFDSPVPEDKEFILKVMMSAPDVFKVDEWRAMAGRKPIGGEEGDSLYVPVTYNSTPLGEDGEPEDPDNQNSSQNQQADRDLVSFSQDLFDVPTRTN